MTGAADRSCLIPTNASMHVRVRLPNVHCLQFMRATNATIIHWWNKPGWSTVLQDPSVAATVCTATTTQQFTPLEGSPDQASTGTPAAATAATAGELAGLQGVVEVAEGLEGKV